MIFHLLLTLSLQLSPLADPPTAVVNVQRVIEESAAGKAATTQLRTFQTQKQKAISDKQAEVQQLRRSTTLPALVEKAQRELQRLTEDADAELKALDRQLQEELSKKLRPVVAQIAEEEHIGIIFQYPQPLIVWASPAIDVTAKVLARLDAEAKKQR